MPYLRCEQCGAKALPIASRCPSCEHPFPPRAGFASGSGIEGRGIDRRRERVCAGCDSLILRSADACRWCGAPQDQGLSKRAIGAIGAAAAVAILAAGFHFWGPNADVVFLTGSSEASPSAAEVQPDERAPAHPDERMRDERTPTQPDDQILARSDEQVPARPDAPAGVSAETELADADGAVGADAGPEGSGSPESGSPGLDSPGSDSGERVSAETRMADTGAGTDVDGGADEGSATGADADSTTDAVSPLDPASDTDPASTTDEGARADEQAPPDSDSPPSVSAETEFADAPGPGPGWVRAVARTFVNIRAVPSSSGEVQGVVPENADVLLGDSRGAWRRVRMAGVTGWAWEPLFQIGSETEGS